MTQPRYRIIYKTRIRDFPQMWAETDSPGEAEHICDALSAVPNVTLCYVYDGELHERIIEIVDMEAAR